MLVYFIVGWSKQDLDDLQGRTGLHALGHGKNFQIFGLNIFGFTTANVNKDLKSFLISTYRGKESRRVWQHLDTGEGDGWDTLEAEEESPADDRVAVVNECKSE